MIKISEICKFIEPIFHSFARAARAGAGNVCLAVSGEEFLLEQNQKKEIAGFGEGQPGSILSHFIKGSFEIFSQHEARW